LAAAAVAVVLLAMGEVVATLAVMAVVAAAQYDI
jgi:hypothetical protein